MMQPRPWDYYSTAVRRVAKGYAQGSFSRTLKEAHNKQQQQTKREPACSLYAAYSRPWHCSASGCTQKLIIESHLRYFLLTCATIGREIVALFFSPNFFLATRGSSTEDQHFFFFRVLRYHTVYA